MELLKWNALGFIYSLPTLNGGYSRTVTGNHVLTRWVSRHTMLIALNRRDFQHDNMMHAKIVIVLYTMRFWSVPASYSPRLCADGRWIVFITFKNGPLVIVSNPFRHKKEIHLSYCQAILFHSSNQQSMWMLDKNQQNLYSSRSDNPHVGRKGCISDCHLIIMVCPHL